jgi:hypothetical protein
VEPLVNPGGEALGRVHVIVGGQAEAVLVETGAPVVAALQKSGV